MYSLKDIHLLDLIDGDGLVINGVRWSPIPDYKGYYINEYGEVASCVKGDFHILKTWTNQHGHEYVGLSAHDGSKVKESVHRLVAKTFIPNPDHYPVVRHLDDEPSNNDVENLAWGTQGDNVKDMYKNGLGSKKRIYCHELKMIFDGGVDAAEYFGVSRSEISLLCNGKNKLLKGKYHLSFLEEVNDYERCN